MTGRGGAEPFAPTSAADTRIEVIDLRESPDATPAPVGERRRPASATTSHGSRSQSDGTAVVLGSPDHPARTDQFGAEVRVVGHIAATADHSELESVLLTLRPRLLLVTAPLDVVDFATLAMCAQLGVEILVLARPAYGMLRPRRTRRLGGMLWLQLSAAPELRGRQRGKRAFDIAIVVATLPLTLTAMVLLSALSMIGGPPLYFQERVGEGGKLFRMVKFRTMTVDAEANTGPVIRSSDDDRVTTPGRLLRRFRLDELPQLWNVLRGDMSLVGPRPERPEFTVEFEALFPHYDLRHLTRPGLTGIAQLTGGHTSHVEEKLRCDLFYLGSRTLLTDLGILVRTFVELLRGFPRG